MCVYMKERVKVGVKVGVKEGVKVQDKKHIYLTFKFTGKNIT